MSVLKLLNAEVCSLNLTRDQCLHVDCLVI